MEVSFNYIFKYYKDNFKIYKLLINLLSLNLIELRLDH